MIKKLFHFVTANHKQESIATQEISLFIKVTELFKHKTIIVHHGLEPNWLAELLKQAGGGAHFRVNTSISKMPTSDIEKFIAKYIEPLSLPKPVLLKFESHTVWIRHLHNKQTSLLPSDVSWVLTEINERYHYKMLQDDSGKIVCSAGIAITDNKIDYF